MGRGVRKNMLALAHNFSLNKRKTIAPRTLVYNLFTVCLAGGPASMLPAFYRSFSSGQQVKLLASDE